MSGNAGHRPIGVVRHPAALSDAALAEALPLTMEPPAVLTDDEAKYWRLWAPLALRTGLLTTDRVPGFVMLCQQAMLAARMRAEINADGLTVVDNITDSNGKVHRRVQAHPLLSKYQASMLRVEQLQARFGLTADGKLPEVEAEPDAERSELAQLVSIR